MPGVGLHVKKVYQMLKFNWAKMDQFYIANPNIEKFKIAKNPKFSQLTQIEIKNIKKAKTYVEWNTYKLNS